MTEDLKGTVFNGRYTVLEKIGAGGMATVFRAKDESTSGFVAVKILSREFLARSPKEAERNLRRFKREAEILRLLAGCPHVVGFVEHACSESGDWFIAMELLEGEQLRYYTGRGRTVMGIPTFAHYAAHLLEGLKEIHGRNILHRDLAPDNVIVVRNEEGLLIPKYLDFGIGKSLVNELDQVTQMLTIMGKPQYFSPEQARGMELTTASDIYSMGVMLYEMVTGYVPLEIHGIPDFRKIQKEPPVPITNWREGQRIPADLQQVIMRCLEKQADQRPLLDEILQTVLRLRDRIQSGEVFDTSGSTGPTADHTAPVKLTEVELRPGDSVSRYEIKKLLGKGGMGAVYLAWDPVLHREIAIKVATRVEEEKAKKALLREARASSALRSDNIVTIFDAGTEGGTPYIAMEYVNGSTLSEIIERDGPITGQRFWELASGILAGLRSAHDRPNPVIHRDLKPANMLVDRRGVKITDFGIARVAGSVAAAGATVAGGGGETGAHALGHGEGTVATMSPEQANGKPADHRSDIYSLGCVLYMMAAGRGPFQGNQISILYQHCTTVPDPPSKHNPALEPEGLDEIILKCLEKEPEKRWQSAAEIETALHELYFPAEAAARPWFKTKAGIGAAAALLVAVGVAVYFAFFTTAPEAPPIAFRLDTVGGVRVPDEPADPAKPLVFFALQRTVPISARAAPGTVVEASASRKDGKGAPAAASATAGDDGVAAIDLELPVGDDAGGAEFAVSVKPADAGAPATGFDLIFDATAPRVQYLAYEGCWRELGESRVRCLDPGRLRFRLTDSGSGFEGPDGTVKREVELDLNEHQRYGPGAAVERTAQNRLKLTVHDRAGNHVTFKILDEERVLPSLRIRDPAPVTAAESLPISCELDSNVFDFRSEPLRQGLKARVVRAAGLPELSVALAPDEAGVHQGVLPLPPKSEIVSGTVDVWFGLLDDVEGAQAFEGSAGMSVRIDRVNPVITLHYAEGVWTSDGAPPDHPLALAEGQEMKNLFEISVEDAGAGFADRAVAEIACADLPAVGVPVPSGGGRLECPAIAFPSTSEPFEVTVRVPDRVGNAATFKFPMKVLGTKVTMLTAGGVQEHAGVLYVTSMDGLEIGVSASNVPEGRSLHVDVVDDAGQTLIAERREMTLQKGVWKATLGRIGGSKPHLRIHTGADRGVTETPLKACRLELDAAPPTLRVLSDAFPDGVPADRADGIVCGHVPRLTFVIEDDQGVVVKADPVETQRFPPSLPELRRGDAGSTGSPKEARVVVEPPLEPLAAGRYIVTVRAEDLAGRRVAASVALDVRPPVFRVPSIAGRPTGGSLPARERPVPVRNQFLELDVANKTGAGQYRLEATLREDGQETGESQRLENGIRGDAAASNRIQGLPGRKGTVFLSAREILGNASGPEVEIGTIPYVVDGQAPEWSVRVKDVPTTLNLAELKSEGVRMTDLADVALVLTDDWGLPPIDPARTAGAEVLEVERSADREIVLRIKRGFPKANGSVKFEVADLAGNKASVDFLFFKTSDRPSLREILAASGESLQELGGGRRGGTGTSYRIACANDAPDVEAVEVRIGAGAAAPAAGVPLAGDAKRRTFQGPVDLPGEGEFTLALHHKTPRGFGAEPFETIKLLVDRTKPDVRILDQGGPAAGPLTVERLDGIRASAADAGSGIRLVEWSLAAPGGSPNFAAAESDGAGTWRLPAGRTAVPGDYELRFRARDGVGLENDSDPVRVTVRAPAAVVPTPIPTPPVASGTRLNQARVTGECRLDPVPITKPGSTAAAFYMSRSEVTVEQFKLFWTKVGSSQNLLGAEYLEPLTKYLEREPPDAPVGFITWQVAVSYCEWVGGRIPTIEEWKNAAGRFHKPDAKWPLYDGKDSEAMLSAKPNWAVVRPAKLKKVTELERGGPYELLGMPGNKWEWVKSLGKYVQFGGSVAYARDSASLDAQPRQPSAFENSLDVGIRVVWDP